MNKIKANCLPFTSDDIITLRGQPIAKRVKPVKNSFLPLIEEWIYYQAQTNTKESYVFKNSRLINWRKEKI